MTCIRAARKPRHRSIRARIAIACAGLFLMLGGILVGATYGLVAHIKPGSGPPAAFECARPGRNQTVARRRLCVRLLESLPGRKRRASQRRPARVRCVFADRAGAGHRAGRWPGWAASNRVLRPLRAITEAARTASQENLPQRLALAGPPDELKELADTFDAMLTRLDVAFASQRRFVANASHELRTPLTEMRALIGVSLAKPTSAARQLEPVLAQIQAAVDKSEELIEALLTLARSDCGITRTELVDLPTAVEDAIDLTGPTVAAMQIRIDTALQHAQVSGDRVLLERLVSNLIDNAIRHNVSGGQVLASTRQRAGHVELTVINDGEPIPADQVTGLFEPFRRLSGRTGGQAGTGLGLCIVASVAKAHGGQAEARARPTGGLEVRVTLPAEA